MQRVIYVTREYSKHRSQSQLELQTATRPNIDLKYKVSIELGVNKESR